jgi:hypothetical protein
MEQGTKLLTTFVETHYTFHVTVNGFSNVCTVTWDENSYRCVVLGKRNKVGKQNHKTMQDAIMECLEFCGSSEGDSINLTIDLTRKFLNLGEHDAVGNLKKV